MSAGLPEPFPLAGAPTPFQPTVFQHTGGLSSLLTARDANWLGGA